MKKNNEDDVVSHKETANKQNNKYINTHQTLQAGS